jgi:hypothetical protein
MNSRKTSRSQRRRAIRRHRRPKADTVRRLQSVTHEKDWKPNRRVSGSQDVYEIRPRKDRRGFDLIGDRLPLGVLWFEGPEAIVDAVVYARFYSRSHPTIIRVFDESGAVVGTHESAGT